RLQCTSLLLLEGCTVQGFDGHGAGNSGVAAKINHAHGTAADFSFNLVATERWPAETLFQDDQGPVGIKAIDAGVTTLAGQCFQCGQPLGNVPEILFLIQNVAVSGRRLVVLPLALLDDSNIVQQPENRTVWCTGHECRPGLI